MRMLVDDGSLTSLNDGNGSIISLAWYFRFVGDDLNVRDGIFDLTFFVPQVRWHTLALR